MYQFHFLISSKAFFGWAKKFKINFYYEMWRGHYDEIILLKSAIMMQGAVNSRLVLMSSALCATVSH